MLFGHSWVAGFGPVYQQAMPAEWRSKGSLAALARFDLHGDGGYHSLAGILVGTRLAVIEHVPLAVLALRATRGRADLADTAVGIAVGCGRSYRVALLVLLAGASVDDGAAVRPGTEWRVAVAVGEGVVGCRQSELALLGEAAVDEDVFVLYFADAGGLEELELPGLIAPRNHVLYNFRTGLHRGHRRGV